MNTTTLTAPDLATILDHSAYTLASLAGVSSPDSSSSAGARFLTDVRDAMAEQVQYVMTSDALDLSEALATEAAREAVSALPTYTADIWATFVDLAAYHVDLSDYGTPDDLTAAASLALFVTAENLVAALTSELESR